MPTTETPTLHLGYGDDERINRNWQILDAFVQMLGSRTIIPEDLLIQGNLEVLGDTFLRGDLTVDGAMNLNALNVTNLGAVNALINNLTVDGTVEFPTNSVPAFSLGRGAAIYDYGTGTPGPVQPIVDFEERELCNVTLSQESLSFLTLVLASITLQFQIGNIAGPRTVSVSLALKRGGVSLQLRSFSYTYVTANQLSIDCPVTLVRFGLPNNPGAWSVTGRVTAGIPAGGGIAVYSNFAQMTAIHFR